MKEGPLGDNYNKCKATRLMGGKIDQQNTNRHGNFQDLPFQ